MVQFCFSDDAPGSGAYDQQGRRKYLNQAENRAFLGEARSLAAAEMAFCLTIFYSGCRISEALALSRESLDLAAETLRIKSLKKRGKLHYRRVPIPSELSILLGEICPNQDEQPIWSFSRATAWRIVKRVMILANLAGPQATAKGLRHSFGVRAAMSKIPVHIIQAWLGHSRASTTAIYVDVVQNEELELIQRTWEI
tara:strand:- start:108 stop:698 length:591 start_codon:yes stop_codon:yes gene_type:complete